MKHVVRHDLGVGKAREVADAAFRSYSERFANYTPRVKWVTGEQAELSFDVKGMTLRGTLAVLGDAIEMDLDVPFLLRPFKGQALGVIEREIVTWISKAKRGELSTE